MIFRRLCADSNEIKILTIRLTFDSETAAKERETIEKIQRELREKYGVKVNILDEDTIIPNTDDTMLVANTAIVRIMIAIFFFIEIPPCFNLKISLKYKYKVDLYN